MFPSPYGGGFMDESVMRVLRDEMERDRKITANGYPCGHVTVHGFRSSFRDWCEDNGHSESLAEAALAHRERDKVIRAYKRSDALERRRVLMEAWGEHCTSPPTVVPIRQPAAV